MSGVILEKSDLALDGNAYEFQGYLHGDAGVSFIWVDMPPGGGPRLHKHPYAEVFIILEGRVTFRLGPETIEARAGQVVIALPDTPHKFVNSGQGPLRQIDIHASESFITEWLED